MTTFKPGDVCWHVTQGVVKLEAYNNEKYPLQDNLGFIYLSDGRIFKDHPFPTLLTLEEARARGFPVPKERLRVEVSVRWEADDDGAFPVGKYDFSALVGRTGVLVFTEDEERALPTGGSK